MKLLLTAISGSREGESFTIEANECITFGRTAASNWSFEDDGHMSSMHFEVENTGAEAEVRDLGSTNGTWLNNQRIQHQKLREGDRLRAGKTVLTVEFVQPPVAAAPASDLRERTQDQQFAPASASTMPTPPDRPLPPKSSPILPPATPPPKTPPPRSPRPEPLRPESHRPINPFDSIDFVDEQSPAAERPPASSLPNRPTEPEYRLNNPISDSSFSFPAPQAPPPPSRRGGAVERHQLLERRTSAEAAEGLAIILDSLSQKWSIQLILHFQKIRTTPPIDSEIHPLFHWYSDIEARAYSPIRLGWNEAVDSGRVLPLIPRLCRADACFAFLGRSAAELEGQIESMITLGLEGFSEADGFLPTCWPSSFLMMMDVAGVEACQSLFADRVSGAIVCSPWNRNKLLGVADSALSEDLVEAEFTHAARVTDP